MQESRPSFVSRREFYVVIAALLLTDISVLHAPRGSDAVEDGLTLLLTLATLVSVAIAWRSGRRGPTPGPAGNESTPAHRAD